MADPHRSRTVSKRLPCILIVDDDLEEADSKRILFSRLAEPVARTPDGVTSGDLRRADLALVDFALEHWRFDRPEIAEHPNDGVALVAVLRSHCAANRSTAFALLSGKVDGLTGGLPPRSHLHQIARANNVEWVFSKNDRENAFPLRKQALSLATAMRDSPKAWPRKQPARMRKIVEGLLAVPSETWRERAWRHVEGCHPPIHELSPPTHAVNLVRWLLHSILPYSTFLWDYRYLAARLRVSPKSMAEALQRDAPLVRGLAPFRYKGLLHDFLGERWWRPGIEHWLWEETKAKSFDRDALKKLTMRLSRRLEPVSMGEPVVAFDHDLRATDKLIELSDAVELQPDDWPAFADRPYAPHDIVMSDDRLKSLVAKTSEA